MEPLNSLSTPEFGCDLLQLLDNPQPGVVSRAVRLVTDAIETWEPRVKVSSVKVSAAVPGESVITVSWYPRGADQAASSAVSTSIPLQGAGSGDYVPKSSVGVPGGVAPLDSYGLVPSVNLPGGDGLAGIVPVAVDGGEVV